MNTILLWGCLLLGFGQSAIDEGDATVSIDAVVDQLTKREQLFFDSESLHIKCSWGATDHLLLNEAEEERLLAMRWKFDLDSVTRAFPQQKIMRTPGYQFELGKRGTKLYEKVINPLDLKYGKLGLIAAYDGQIGVELQEDQHAIITSEPPAYSWQNWDYAFLLHLNIHKYVAGFDPKTRFPMAIRPLNLPEDLVEAREQYSFAAEEVLDGVPCVVLDKSDEARFWLDPKLGFAVMGVDRHIAGQKRAHGSMRTSVRMADYREVRPGLSLPWKITEEVYFSTERGPAEFVGMPAVRRTLSLESIEFDTLNDEFFEVRLPAWVLVHDNIRNIEYQNQKDGVPFSKAIEFAAQHPGPPNVATRWLIVSNIALFGIIALMFFLKRDRGEPRP